MGLRGLVGFTWCGSGRGVLGLGLLGLGLLGLAACQGEPAVFGVPPALWIEPSSAALPLGDTLELRVMEEPQDNRDTSQDVTSRVLSWRVSDPSVLEVQSGFVNGRSEGQATVTAEVRDRGEAIANITVLPSEPRSIRLSPRELRLRPADTGAFVAFLGFANSQETEVTGSSIDAWSSSRPEVVSVDASGQVLALPAEPEPSIEAIITATREGLPPATAVVKVKNATLIAVDVRPTGVVVDEGETRNLQATCRYSDDTAEDCTDAARWACLDEDVCTCNGGLLTATGVGRTRCTATLETDGRSAEVLVEVGDCRLTALRLTPPSQSVPLGSTAELFARAEYSCGQEEDVTDLVDLWSYAPPGVAVVDDIGTVSALSRGTTEITATFAGRSSEPVTLTVVGAQPVKIECTPAFSRVEQGQRICLEATLITTNGSMPVTDASWAVENPRVAEADAAAANCFVGIAAGTTTVRVTEPAVAVAPGRCTLDVLPPNRCVVVPGGTNMLIGETFQFEVKLEGANNRLSPIPSGVTPAWSVSSTGTLNLQNSGFVEASGTGSANVEATAMLGGLRRRCRPATVFVAERCAVFPGNFENGIQPWSATNGVWEVGVPTAGPEGCFEGSMCAATTLEGNATASSGLLSPFITLCTVRPGQVIELWYWQWFSINGRGQVWWSGPDATMNWLPGALAGLSGGWTFGAKDLTALAGQRIQVGFWLGTFGGTFGWALDQVEIVRY